MTTSDPTAFVASVGNAFEDAVERVGAVDRDYRIAGRTIRVQLAGHALEDRLTPAFAHLREPAEGRPDVVFRVWDSASTGASMPAPPWSWDAFCARGDIKGFNTDTVRVAYHAGPAALSVFDAATGVASYWVSDAARFPLSESSAPLRTLLHWWLETEGLQLVHGAAVGLGTRGLLLAGDGGSGKSSTALACLEAGWALAGDDYCVAEVADAPRAHSLYCTAKVDGPARDRLRRINTSAAVPLADRGKLILTLWPEYADKLVAAVPIDAILLPRVVDGRETTIRPASATSAIRALAPSTMRQLPGAGARTWQTVTRLIHHVPGYHLDLGTDVDMIPEVMARVFDQQGIVG